MAHDRSKVALRFPMIGLRCSQDGLQVPSYGVSSVSQQCFFGILQFLPSNIADESQIYCRRAFWDHLRAVFIFQGKLHFLKMGLPCRRDAPFYIICSTFTPPLSCLQVAFGVFDSALMWVRDGAKMAHDAFKILYDRLKIAPCWRESHFPYDVSSVSRQCSFGVLQPLPSNIADES